VGRSTAAAISVFAFGGRAAILDGNVKRVLARCFGIEGERAQWELAGSLLPLRAIDTYTQALMDLGATICTRARPACVSCPVAKGCVALAENRIAELPSPRRRKPLPLRRATWLVLQHQGAVLLERRPSPGIWGGLWVFPDGPSERLQSFCRKNFFVEISGARKMPVIRHGFTHFRLDILPIRCNVRRKLHENRKSGRLWLEVSDAKGAAVPAPVRALLSGLALPFGRDQAPEGFQTR
jgi:A/G-specific adenine glycosylase